MQLSPQELQQKLEPRVRTIRILWLAMLLSILMYYLLSLFVGHSKNATPNNVLSIVLVVIGISTTLVSIAIKSKFLARAVEQQQVEILQQGYIIAWALAEVAALLGLMDFFATGNRFYYVGFIVGAIGQLVNSPRRQDILAASFKTPLV